MARALRASFVLVSLLLGCGGAERAPARRAPVAAAPAPSPAARSAARASARDPKALAADADAIYQAQLALSGRDERFAVDRQVTELRRAILLYEQFIERAGGAPEFADAVKRSRERVEDAKATIDFFLEGAETGTE